eukprot:Amastigsp_a851768_8.p4 type:complete len:154 gc:universal Amastigsp_a851768_8:324-785(+)
MSTTSPSALLRISATTAGSRNIASQTQHALHSTQRRCLQTLTSASTARSAHTRTPTRRAWSPRQRLCRRRRRRRRISRVPQQEIGSCPQTGRTTQTGSAPQPHRCTRTGPGTIRVDERAPTSSVALRCQLGSAPSPAQPRDHRRQPNAAQCPS